MSSSKHARESPVSPDEPGAKRARPSGVPCKELGCATLCFDPKKEGKQCTFGPTCKSTGYQSRAVFCKEHGPICCHCLPALVGKQNEVEELIDDLYDMEPSGERDELVRDLTKFLEHLEGVEEGLFYDPGDSSAMIEWAREFIQGDSDSDYDSESDDE